MQRLYFKLTDMISDSKWKSLEAQMLKWGIFEKDIEEHFIRSGGKGGQNVNKVNTCVYLKHLPSNIEVKCQETRSQIDNRFLARRILCEKIEHRVLGQKSAEARERNKIRKQKKKRSKRAKEKMLQDKKSRSERKQLRQRPEF